MSKFGTNVETMVRAGNRPRPLLWKAGGKPRVLILGCGFAGLEACKSLAQSPCEIILIDRQNHHLFQPLLYQVATAGLSGSDIAQPLRSIVGSQRNAEVHRATVTHVDLKQSKVTLAGTKAAIEFDFLVIAMGMVANWFGKPEWARHAVGLKNLHDANRIRDRLLDAAEQAENQVDAPANRDLLLTTVVVGGGPTGVEMAGAIAELSRRAIETEFRVIQPGQLRVVLITADDRLLPSFDPSLSARAFKDLQALGVDVRLKTIVKDLRDREVVLETEVIHAHTTVWAAGVTAPQLTRSLGVPIDRSGRFVVEPNCSLPGYPKVFAVGDIAAMVHNQGFVPGVAQGALQSGAFVGRQLRSALEEEPATRFAKFSFKDRGSVATIGRARAIVEIKGMKFAGLFAWLIWLTIHLLFLIDLRSKLTVTLKWIAAYVFYRPTNRIIAPATAEDEAP